MKNLDVYGKDLHDYEVRIGNTEGVPKIFEILRGYFLKDDEKHLKAKGIFRITSTKKSVQDLALYMSQGNYAMLEDERYQDPCLVANVWKHLLRDMKFPLIPIKYYDQFSALAEIDESIRR